MKAWRNTKRSILQSHIINVHRRIPAKTMPYEAMAKWHSTQHHALYTNHYHEGSNLGPDKRPEGWRTGEGVVMREREQ